MNSRFFASYWRPVRQIWSPKDEILGLGTGNGGVDDHLDRSEIDFVRFQDEQIQGLVRL